MDSLLGLLRVHVERGTNLPVRDVRTSDPYVVLRMGRQKLKTRVIKKNINPEWNEDLTLSVRDPTLPVKLEVYDKDTFTLDDPMGDAEFDIQPFVDVMSRSFKVSQTTRSSIDCSQTGRTVSRKRATSNI